MQLNAEAVNAVLCMCQCPSAHDPRRSHLAPRHSTPRKYNFCRNGCRAFFHGHPPRPPHLHKREAMLRSSWLMSAMDGTVQRMRDSGATFARVCAQPGEQLLPHPRHAGTVLRSDISRAVTAWEVQLRSRTCIGVMRDFQKQIWSGTRASP